MSISNTNNLLNRIKLFLPTIAAANQGMPYPHCSFPI